MGSRDFRHSSCLTDHVIQERTRRLSDERSSSRTNHYVGTKNVFDILVFNSYNERTERSRSIRLRYLTHNPIVALTLLSNDLSRDPQDRRSVTECETPLRSLA